MVNWELLIKVEKETRNQIFKKRKINWRDEAKYSICELYYTQYKAKKSGSNERIDFRTGSDFNEFMKTHIEPLNQFEIWPVLFPSLESTQTANAINEALHLLVDSKIIDRVYSGDVITVFKLIPVIRKKRSKYLDSEELSLSTTSG